MKTQLISDPNVISSKYPYLGLHEVFKNTLIDSKTVVVLFSDQGTGTIVYTEDQTNYPLGKQSDKWDENEFIYFKATVTLSND